MTNNDDWLQRVTEKTATLPNNRFFFFFVICTLLVLASFAIGVGDYIGSLDGYWLLQVPLHPIFGYFIALIPQAAQIILGLIVIEGFREVRRSPVRNQSMTGGLQTFISDYGFILFLSVVLVALWGVDIWTDVEYFSTTMRSRQTAFVVAVLVFSFMSEVLTVAVIPVWMHWAPEALTRLFKDKGSVPKTPQRPVNNQHRQQQQKQNGLSGFAGVINQQHQQQQTQSKSRSRGRKR